MDNGSTTEATGELGAVDLAEPGAVSLRSTTTGYCTACGTWDTHSLICKTCGYDFAGAPRDPA